ncbi:MAG TPA: zinc ribbon domain-containing protein [Gaiellaceae bacterium]|nr:zinc ribbon domain-containing protein [Gaiellaceae bacterium]
MIGSLHSILHSTGFVVARDVLVAALVVVWLGLAHRTYRDARRRIDDGWLVGASTLLGLVPVAGPLVYLLFRPPETLEESHARRVEVRALEARLQERRPHCPVCRTPVEAAYVVCPICTTQLKHPCVACKAPLESLWQVCPYCATPVGAAVADLDTALAAEATAASVARKPRKRAAGRATAG